MYRQQPPYDPQQQQQQQQQEYTPGLYESVDAASKKKRIGIIVGIVIGVCLIVICTILGHRYYLRKSCEPPIREALSALSQKDFDEYSD
jgi:hypothetical protein